MLIKLLKKRWCFIKRCKDHLNKRWMKKYVHLLEERQQKLVATNFKISRGGAIILLKDKVKKQSTLES